MRYALAIIVLLLIAITGYLVFIPDSSISDPLPPLHVEEAAAALATPPPSIDRAPTQPSIEPTPVASPPEPELRWSDDPQTLEGIKRDFNSSFAENVAQTVAAAESLKSGDRQLRKEIAEDNSTMLALHLREDDFSSLTQRQKFEIARLMGEIADKRSEKDGWISSDLTDAEAASLKATVLAKAIYYPPEFVLEAQGLQEKLNHPEFAQQVRALRVRIYCQAAPHLENLFDTVRFANAAIMRAGVHPFALGDDYDANAALVTRLVEEQQLRLAALSREFVLGCEEIGRRYN